jgi:hypothetical protein
MTPNLELKKLEFLKTRIEELYKTYEEPEFDKEGKYIRKQIKKAPVINAEADTEMNQEDIDMQEE